MIERESVFYQPKIPNWLIKKLTLFRSPPLLLPKHKHTNLTENEATSDGHKLLKYVKLTNNDRPLSFVHLLISSFDSNALQKNEGRLRVQVSGHKIASPKVLTSLVSGHNRYYQASDQSRVKKN